MLNRFSGLVSAQMTVRTTSVCTRDGVHARYARGIVNASIGCGTMPSNAAYGKLNQPPTSLSARKPPTRTISIAGTVGVSCGWIHPVALAIHIVLALPDWDASFEQFNDLMGGSECWRAPRVTRGDRHTDIAHHERPDSMLDG